MSPTKKPPATVENTDVRRTNLSAVLRRFRDAGPCSRAALTKELGLAKAAASSLVSELVERGLLREGEIVPSHPTGRPARLYALSDRVYGIGVEISADYISVIVLDLSGAVRVSQRLSFDVQRASTAECFDAAAQLVRDAVEQVPPGRLAGLVVAAPGNVDEPAGRVTYAANLEWHNVPVVEELSRRLPELAHHIAVDNDVRLSAIAEYAMGAAAHTPHLAYLSGEMGVAAAVVVEGRLMRGSRGLGWEIGHLPLNPEPAPCACGRRGCWETMVGLGALLRLAADPDDPVRDPDQDLEVRLAEIVRRAEAGDARTLGALERIATAVGLGASVLLNLVNPEVLVLGGYFSVLDGHLIDGIERELRERVVAPDFGGCRVEFSQLKFTAAALGGAHIAFEQILADPAIMPRRGH